MTSTTHHPAGICGDPSCDTCYVSSVHDLPPPIAEAINEAKVQESTLLDLGGRVVCFEGDPIDGMPTGEIAFDDAKVIFYRVGSEWEIDIITSNGGGIGFDVPIAKCSARTAEQIAEAKARDAGHDESR